MSIAKRMKNMCIHMNGVNRPFSNSIPVPGSRPVATEQSARLARETAGVSSRSHSTVPRV